MMGNLVGRLRRCLRLPWRLRRRLLNCCSLERAQRAQRKSGKVAARIGGQPEMAVPLGSSARLKTAATKPFDPPDQLSSRFDAEDHAGYVVGLARCSHEGVDRGHQE